MSLHGVKTQNIAVTNFEISPINMTYVAVKCAVYLLHTRDQGSLHVRIMAEFINMPL
jgi:hypothetical protein